jgi:Flagellar transcriptional activator (FlhD).
MNSSELLAEIQELNMSYLLLAQRLLAEDRATARLRLKLSEEMADLLSSLNARQLARLSRINQMLFTLSFDVPQLQKLIQDEREPGLAQTHASILLAR